MTAPATELLGAEFTAFFKERYPQRKIEDLVAFEKPTLSAIKRDGTKLTGKKTYVPIELDSPQGMSGNLGKAISNVTSSVGDAWQLTPTPFYAALTIDAMTMLAGADNKGAFFRTREHEFNRILEQIGQHNEMMLWGAGSGRLGKVSGSHAAEVITLSEASDTINFHIGMTVRFYDGLASDADQPDSADESATAGPYTVLSVDHDAGTVTFDGAPALNADVVDGDIAVRDGNIDSVFKGIPAWIPATVTSTAFHSIDRTDAPQQLAGHRQAWLGTIEETVKKLDSTIRRFNQKPKCLWLSYANFNRLDVELSTRGYRKEDGGKGVFGRMSLGMATPGGGIEIKAGPYVPEDAGYLLDMSTWELLHLGGLPHLVKDDGLSATRLTSDSSTARDGDGIELRVRQFCELLCTNPFANGRITIV